MTIWCFSRLFHTNFCNSALMIPNLHVGDCLPGILAPPSAPRTQLRSPEVSTRPEWRKVQNTEKASGCWVCRLTSLCRKGLSGQRFGPSRFWCIKSRGGGSNIVAEIVMLPKDWWYLLTGEVGAVGKATQGLLKEFYNVWGGEERHTNLNPPSLLTFSSFPSPPSAFSFSSGESGCYRERA